MQKQCIVYSLDNRRCQFKAIGAGMLAMHIECNYKDEHPSLPTYPGVYKCSYRAFAQNAHIHMCVAMLPMKPHRNESFEMHAIKVEHSWHIWRVATATMLPPSVTGASYIVFAQCFAGIEGEKSWNNGNVCVCVRLLELRNVHFFLGASVRVCCLPSKQCVRDEFLQILSFNQAITIYQQIYSVCAFCAAHSFSLSFTARLAVLWAAYCRPSGNCKGKGFVAMVLWQIAKKNEMQTYKSVNIDMHSTHTHTNT